MGERMLTTMRSATIAANALTSMPAPMTTSRGWPESLPMAVMATLTFALMSTTTGVRASTVQFAGVTAAGEGR